LLSVSDPAKASLIAGPLSANSRLPGALRHIVGS
jgi:hypothetical protein